MSRIEQDLGKIFTQIQIAPTLLKLSFGSSLKGMDDNSIRELMTKLHARGVLLAVEGSSLSPALLQELPIQRLDISTPTLEQLTDSAADIAITHAIICLAKSVSALSSTDQVTSKEQ
ncbi:MAG: hypothetical protein V7739_21195 [Motiliproteus sp.]